MRARAGAVLLACAAALAVAPGALAQERVTVIGPTAAGARLVVFDRHGELCGRVRKTGEPPERYADCGRPTGALRAPLLSSIRVGTGEALRVWGVVAREVARVEAVMENGERHAVDTVAGDAYRGRFAGVGRFFLLAVPAGSRKRLTEAGYLRELDSQGNLLAVVDLGYETRSGPPALLAGGELGGVRWRLRAAAHRALAPLPGNEEHFGRSLCINLRWELGGGGICTQAGYPGDSLIPFGGQDCDGLGTTLVGLLPPGTRAVAVLGSGRRLALPTYGLPRRLGTGRVLGIPLGVRTAVRRIDYTRRNGRHSRVELGLAPARVNCVGLGGSGLLIGFDPLFPTHHGQPGLRVEDRGRRLCVTLAGTRLDDADCGLPPVEPFSARVLSLPGASSTYVGGVFPADVARVEFELDGTERLSVAATPDGLYTGRYAGLIRFAETSVAGRHALTGTRLFDAQGRLIHKRPGPDPAPLSRKPVTLLRTATGEGLSAGLVAPSAQGPSAPCITLSAKPPASSADCGQWWQGSLTARVSCRPRAIAFWGVVGANVRSVEVRTESGSVRGRLARLPRALESGRQVVLAELPGDATPRELIVRRARGANRVRLPMSSARRQCGFDAMVTFASPYF